MSAKTNAEVVIDGRFTHCQDMRMRNTYRRLRHTSTTRLQSLMIWMSISIFRAI